MNSKYSIFIVPLLQGVYLFCHGCKYDKHLLNLISHIDVNQMMENSCSDVQFLFIDVSSAGDISIILTVQTFWSTKKNILTESSTLSKNFNSFLLPTPFQFTLTYPSSLLTCLSNQHNYFNFNVCLSIRRLQRHHAPLQSFQFLQSYY